MQPKVCLSKGPFRSSGALLVFVGKWGHPCQFHAPCGGGARVSSFSSPPFGRSKLFSGAFGASKNSTPLGGGGGGGGGWTTTTQPRWAVCATGAGAHQGQTSREGKRDIRWTARTARGGTGHLGLQETQRGRATDGLWTEVCGQRKQSNDPHNNQHNPQYANYWAPLMRKRHILPHPAQPRHTNDWARRTRKRHRQEHRPQRPTERSDPTQHAEGRTGGLSRAP